jgi:hypothetical protein
VDSFTASAPFGAESGQTYSGLEVSNPDGPCIAIRRQSDVRIVDSRIGPCGGEAAIVVDDSVNVIIEHNDIHDSARGVLTAASTAVDTLSNHVHAIDGAFPRGTAIEYDFMEGGGSIDGNCVEGDYGSDAISVFESSNVQLTGNELHVNMLEWSAAAFTLGDSVAGTPGHDNYAAWNKVFQTNGVPAGVFGSSGNTVLEHNCLTAGIQAYQYNGPFVGVVIRYNIIGPGSYVPDPSVIEGWDTNTFTDGSSCDGM